jgi:hypothetical protein
MFCQNCQQQEATVHFAGHRTAHSDSGGQARPNEFEFHLCPACAEEYQQSQLSQSLFPGEPQRTERFRVVGITPERTVLRLIRAESDSPPEEWSLLTSRLPESFSPIGSEITMTFTPSELAWLRGERDI